MEEIAITVISSNNTKSGDGVPNLYLLTGSIDCIRRALFQANSQGWSPSPLTKSQISVLTTSSIDEVKEEVQSWFNPDVVKVVVK